MIQRSRWLRVGLPAAALAALLQSQPASGQTGACGPGNARNFCADQNLLAIAGAPEQDDRFGAAVSFGDFDGDGKADLAIGAPGENSDAGFVHVLYTRGFALDVQEEDAFFQAGLAGGEASEAGDEFGATLAAGDFDGDGFDDLAIGAPGEDLPGCPFGCDETGVVHVVPGGAGGLTLASAIVIAIEDLGIAAVNPEDDQRFGAALAVGDINGDLLDDLVVGIPENDVSQLTDQGDVVVLYGSAGGLNEGATATRAFSPELPCEGERQQIGFAVAAGRTDGDITERYLVGVPFCDLSGGNEVGGAADFGEGTNPMVETDFGSAGLSSLDHFGIALAVGDFDGDGFDDAAIAAPNKNHGTGNPSDSGRVYVAFGSGSGLDPADFQILGEDDFAGQTPAADEPFGTAMVAGDFDGDGRDDLVLGAPGEGSGTGKVFALWGTAGGLDDVAGRVVVVTQTALGGASGSDLFGSAFAAGDLDGDGVDELAIGVPDEDVVETEAGMVYVTRVLDPRLVFLDGFESGAPGLWSDSAP